MRARVLFLLLVIGASRESLAEEYFGEFKNELAGEFVTVDPRPLFRLRSEFGFVDPNGLLWKVPAEKEVDGASIPPPFWSVIGGPFSGKYINASVIHDYYCDVKVRTEHDTHRNFYYGMRSSGVAGWKAKFMYWAVATFGPKWKLEQRLVQEIRCSSDAGRSVCRPVPVKRTVAVEVAEVDLGDPVVLATALGKASAVARSLRTSDGAVLDVSAKGPVAASVEGILASADGYRNLFSTRAYLERPAELGVLSQWTAGGLDEVQVWEGERQPAFEDALELDAGSLGLIGGGRHFRMGDQGMELIEGRLDVKSLEMEMQRIE